MNRNDVIKAYVRMREIDSTIPDEVLDLMKESALAALEKDPSKRLSKVSEEVFDIANGVVGDDAENIAINLNFASKSIRRMSKKLAR